MEPETPRISQNPIIKPDKIEIDNTTLLSREAGVALWVLR
jgi:hypothetical protein